MDYKVIRHKDDERKDHKYIARVKVKSSGGKKDKWRYFYTMPEYKAYLNGQKKTKETSSKKKSISDIVKGLFVKKKTDSKPKSETSKKLTNEPKAAKKTTIKEVKKNGSSKLSDLISKGKKTAEKILKNVDKKVDKIATKAEKIVDKATMKVEKSTTKSVDKAKKNENAKTLNNALIAGEKFVDKQSDKEAKSLTLLIPTSLVAKTLDVIGDVVESVSNKIEDLFDKDEDRDNDENNESPYNAYDNVTEFDENDIPKSILKMLDNAKDECCDFLERLAYQENEPDFMKDIPEIDDDIAFTKFEDQEQINELYDPWDRGETTTNCSNCSAAYELRRRGYDVEAVLREFDPSGDPVDDYNGRGDRIYDYFKDAELINVYGDGSTATSNESFMHKLWDDNLTVLEAELKYKDDYDFLTSTQKYSGDSIAKAITENNPPGSRGFIDVEWNDFNGDGVSDGAHSIVYEVDTKGKVTIRDSQTWDEYDTDELASRVSKVRIARTDNLELKEEILNAVKPNEKNEKKRKYYIDENEVWPTARGAWDSLWD